MRKALQLMTKSPLPLHPPFPPLLGCVDLRGHEYVDEQNWRIPLCLPRLQRRATPFAGEIPAWCNVSDRCVYHVFSLSSRIRPADNVASAGRRDPGASTTNRRDCDGLYHRQFCFIARASDACAVSATPPYGSCPLRHDQDYQLRTTSSMEAWSRRILSPPKVTLLHYSCDERIIRTVVAVRTRMTGHLFRLSNLRHAPVAFHGTLAALHARSQSSQDAEVSSKVGSLR